MECFGRLRRPLRAMEISRVLGLHPSTANQLLKTMVESAHLTFDAATKTYLPSHRLTSFGAWLVENYGADERLRGLVRDVQAATGELVTLTTPNDLFMQIVDLSGMPAADDFTERGLRISIFGSAIGAAFLSTQKDAEVARLAERARIAPADLRELQSKLVEVRRDGVADGSALGGELWSVAAPLPAEVFPTPLVLGLSGPNARVQANLGELRELLPAAIARWVPRQPVPPQAL